MDSLATPILVPQREFVPRRHVSSLDGLRGIALVLVVLHHAGFPGLKWGLVGVDLFFVLSGFLISTLLITEFQSTGTISLARFWGRRFLRLMPVYWLYVGMVTLLILFSGQPFYPALGWTRNVFIASLWLYFHNYLPPFVPFTHWQQITGHLWSLCIEEQFYFLWPGLLFFALRCRKAELISWLLVLAVLVRRHFVAHDDVSVMMFRIDTRGFAIILGCAVAVSMFRVSRQAPHWFMSPWLLNTAIGAALLTMAPFVYFYANDKYPEFFFIFARWLLPLLAIEFAAVTALLWYGPPSAVTRFLSFAPLAYIGKISYGLYIYHPIAHYLTWHLWLAGIDNWPSFPKYGLRLVVYFALTFAMAVPSYHFYERFFLRLKSRLR